MLLYRPHICKKSLDKKNRDENPSLRSYQAISLIHVGKTMIYPGLYFLFKY